jgi:hypothetical protein
MLLVDSQRMVAEGGARVVTGRHGERTDGCGGRIIYFPFPSLCSPRYFRYVGSEIGALGLRDYGGELAWANYGPNHAFKSPGIRLE